ncbi:OmpH family outer membrane protein [Lutibacter sp. B1]|uniref:OmpH family outer membrane protein n=1 Tax=Lutibacter sp. B1 TaxID=2725996 RepID=UPI0014577529|nr:OmpH family outer membrane protein [Lutibacter sp. B1]NLP58625.1 OmpH family outer membrane protein [Lutibacter sp. B1]
MAKRVLLFTYLILSLSSVAIAQKAQRIGYIDMEYILENIPEYTEAQAKINVKANTWQNTIDKQKEEIENLKTELNNEKPLLTKELIEEKEEDIQIKELELKKLQAAYFGANGDLFFLRQQLVQPIQDLVYNSVQDIATKRRYDFILDKSSDLIMLYSNKQYDVSDIVIKEITRAKKVNALNEKQNKVKNTLVEDDDNETVVNEKAQQKLDEREARKAELQKRIEEQKAEKLKKREELRKAIEEKRQQRIKQIEEAKKAKEEKKENN